jgi:DNA-binding transcriptional MerR regulator
MRYSIAAVARAFGTRISALRYYDELGLLRPAGRRGAVRVYGHAELRRLAMIQLLHRDGLLSLTTTASLLADDPAAAGTTNRMLLDDALKGIDDRIRRLEDARHVLRHVLSCPRDDPIRDCPVLRERFDRTVAVAMASAGTPMA